MLLHSRDAKESKRKVEEAREECKKCTCYSCEIAKYSSDKCWNCKTCNNNLSKADNMGSIKVNNKKTECNSKVDIE